MVSSATLQISVRVTKVWVGNSKFFTHHLKFEIQFLKRYVYKSKQL